MLDTTRIWHVVLLVITLVLGLVTVPGTAGAADSVGQGPTSGQTACAQLHWHGSLPGVHVNPDECLVDDPDPLLPQ